MKFGMPGKLDDLLPEWKVICQHEWEYKDSSIPGPKGKRQNFNCQKSKVI